MRRTVYYRRLDPDAKMPERAYGGKHPDAGWDLFALDEVMLFPAQPTLVPTGIAVQLPIEDGYVWEAQIRSRSGLRLKGIVIPVGTIDSGYRGDVGCIAINVSREPYLVKKGEKVCQMIVTRMPAIEMIGTDELESSERGENRFGSTGE